MILSTTKAVLIPAFFPLASTQGFRIGFRQTYAPLADYRDNIAKPGRQADL
jgi:hypothetical protein